MSSVFLLKGIQGSIRRYLGRIGQKLRSTVKDRNKKSDRNKNKNLEDKINQLQTDKLNQGLKDSDDSFQQEKTEASPDMFLDVPQIKTEEIKLTLEDLDARVALHAELARVVKINVGVSAAIKKLDLDIKGLDLKALLKVKLKNVQKIFNRALESIDKNPDILKETGESSGSGKLKKTDSFINDIKSPEHLIRKEDNQSNDIERSSFERKEGNHKDVGSGQKSFKFRNLQKNYDQDERDDTQDAQDRIIKDKENAKTYEEVEKKKNGVEKFTKIVLSPELADSGNTATAIAGVKKAIEGRSSIRKNRVFRFFRLNR